MVNANRALSYGLIVSDFIVAQMDTMLQINLEEFQYSALKALDICWHL